jgi:glutathione S-transferase
VGERGGVAAVVVWDSLAIIEWVAERAPSLWPANAAARAVARSVCAEMHAGFSALRTHMSMNIAATVPWDAAAYPAACHADVARVCALWADCRQRFARPEDGPFLFGNFTAADAMYAPVVTRFRTYSVPLPPDAQAYCDAIWALPDMQAWIAAARAEVAVTK